MGTEMCSRLFDARALYYTFLQITECYILTTEMNKEGFGHCSNTEACEMECPQRISTLHIAREEQELNKNGIV